MFQFLENIVKQVNDSLNTCMPNRSLIDTDDAMTGETNTQNDRVQVDHSQMARGYSGPTTIVLPQQHDFQFNNTVIYCRVSRENQNMDAQKDACIEFCNRLHLNVIQIVCEKKSSFKCKQVGLAKIMNTHSNCNLIVFRVDRLCRNIGVCNKLITDLEKNNIVLYSVSDSINLTNAYGKNLFRQLVSTAQYESELISERGKVSIAFRKKHGLAIGGCIPYGYEKVNGRILPNKSEQLVLKFIATLYKRTLKLSNINDLFYRLLISLDNKEPFVPIAINENEADYNSNDLIKVTVGTIADILNDYNILRKGKEWTNTIIFYDMKRFNNEINKSMIKIANMHI